MADEEKHEAQDEQAAEAADATPSGEDQTPPGAEAPPDGGGDTGDSDLAALSDVMRNEDDASGSAPAGESAEVDDGAAMTALLDDLPEEDSKATLDDINFEGPEVSRAQFQHLSQPAGQSQPRNIDILMDVNLPVSIELGRTRMSISDILGLGPGSVVELNKLAGEPVDVLINQKIVAKGEVVVIDENFGVRITQLMTPEQRLKLLSEEQ